MMRHRGGDVNSAEVENPVVVAGGNMEICS